MVQVYNFEKKMIKNVINKKMGFGRLEYEILLTAMKYIYTYMERELEDPIGEIHPASSTEELFDGNNQRFAYAFIEISKYWEIEFENLSEIPFNREFEAFPTVESLCLFFEDKIMRKRFEKD